MTPFCNAGKSAIRLQTPLTEEAVRGLKAGDLVLLSGTVFTGRDEVHKYLHKGGDLPALQNGVIYHCGPVVLEEGGTYRVVAADARSPRDGRFIEIVGTYEPRQDPSKILIDNDKAVAWLRKGAQPTDRVQKLLVISGAWDSFKGGQ